MKKCRKNHNDNRKEMACHYSCSPSFETQVGIKAFKCFYLFMYLSIADTISLDGRFLQGEATLISIILSC